MGPEALLKQKIKQKRHREGYEDGLSSSHRQVAGNGAQLHVVSLSCVASHALCCYNLVEQHRHLAAGLLP